MPTSLTTLGFSPSPTASCQINANPDEECDLEFGALQQLALDKQLMAYKHNGYWQCMDTLRDAEYLNKLWKSENPPWKVW